MFCFRMEPRYGNVCENYLSMLLKTNLGLLANLRFFCLFERLRNKLSYAMQLTAFTIILPKIIS